MGGAVEGVALYANFPGYGRRNPNHNEFDSSSDQLGRWLGLTDTQLLDVFPNLRNVTTRNLGFMA